MARIPYFFNSRYTLGDGLDDILDCLDTYITNVNFVFEATNEEGEAKKLNLIRNIISYPFERLLPIDRFRLDELLEIAFPEILSEDSTLPDSFKNLGKEDYIRLRQELGVSDPKVNTQDDEEDSILSQLYFKFFERHETENLTFDRYAPFFYYLFKLLRIAVYVVLAIGLNFVVPIEWVALLIVAVLVATLSFYLLSNLLTNGYYSLEFNKPAQEGLITYFKRTNAIASLSHANYWGKS